MVPGVDVEAPVDVDAALKVDARRVEALGGLDEDVAFYVLSGHAQGAGVGLLDGLVEVGCTLGRDVFDVRLAVFHITVKAVAAMVDAVEAGVFEGGRYGLMATQGQWRA